MSDAAWARWLLGFLRVPPEPHLPAGEPGTARVFRAAPNFWRLKLAQWTLNQAFTLLGFLFFVGFAHTIPDQLVMNDKGRQRRIPLATPMAIVRNLETLALVAWLVQLPITLAIIRLDYELRWYVVTDRAARLREGVMTLAEMTFTLVNVQDIRIRQGPLQRLLGLADVELRTAGGTESPMQGGHSTGASHNLHVARFRGVSNAETIRDLVLARMQRARDAGLGDPDDAAGRDTGGTTVEDAIRELVSESAALRHAVSDPAVTAG